MSTFRNLRDPHPLGDGSDGYLVTLEIDAGEGWEETLYVARPNGGGLSDDILATIIEGNFTGAISPLPPLPAPAPPASLQRAAFWLYLLTLGQTRADIHAALDTMLAANQITADYAARLRIKIDDAAVYERLDPDLLDMAQRLGLAADQAALDAHFLAAAG